MIDVYATDGHVRNTHEVWLKAYFAWFPAASCSGHYCLTCPVRLSGWYRNYKSGASSFCAPTGDLTMVRINYLLAEIEPEAGAR
jgi:hypothetical protein